MTDFTSQLQPVIIKPRLKPSRRTRSASQLLITVVVLPQLAMPADVYQGIDPAARALSTLLDNKPHTDGCNDERPVAHVRAKRALHLVLVAIA